MATLVKFLKDRETNEVFAYFPNINYNENAYGSSQKLCYDSSAQHGPCSVEYSLECAEASKQEYSDLLNELEQIGYTEITVVNQLKDQIHQNNTYNEALDKLSKETKDFDTFCEESEKLDKKFGK